MRRRRFASGRTVGVSIVAAVLAACIGVTAPPAPATLPARSATGLLVAAVGDIADCGRRPASSSAAARTAALVTPGTVVLGLGDMAYPYADAGTLASCYGPTWGVHRESTLATPGNHDYVGGAAQDFVRYFGLPLAPADGFIAYSERLSDEWLLIALDSNVSGDTLQAQYRWLERTLATAWDAERQTTSGPTRRCLLVTWHAPLYSSGLHRGSGERMRPFWNLLDQHGADLVLSGHEHFYERFEPLDAQGRPRESAPRQFVVGTGGAPLHGFWKPPYLSRARVLEHGVLELVLDPGRYTWRFLDVDGRVRDAGAARCRAAVN